MPDLIFFWLLFGPIIAFVAFGIGGAAVLLIGALVGAASDGLLRMITAWRKAAP